VRLRRGSFVAGVCVTGTVVLVGLCVLGPAGAVVAGSPSKAGTSTAVPNLIKNGSFSIPKYFSAASVEPGGSYQIPGWTEGAAGVIDDANSFIESPPGASQEVSLWDQGLGTLTQTIKTTPGTTYLLQWYGAGEPGGPAPTPAVKVLHVLWNGAVVAHPSYNTAGATLAKMMWSLGKVVVTATSTTSTLEFEEATPGGNNYAAIVAEVSLAGDANLFLPHATSLVPSGKLTAIVHNGEGEPFTQTGLTVRLYATYKTASYAPATKQLLATGPVTGGQAVLQLHLPTSLKGQTLEAHANLTGPNYIPTTINLTIKVT
jgi:hypothetical protein